jgi:uncharacterized protein with PIN domain
LPYSQKEDEEKETAATQYHSSTPRFIVDGMLGSLAIKLRILGFDTIYDKSSTDQELISNTLREGRFLVTSDKELFLHSKQRHAKAILVTGKTEEERLLELSQKAGIDHLSLSKTSRCSTCNFLLQETGRTDELGRSIYKCENCDKLYWRGSHWKKLDILFSGINRSLSSKSGNKE